MNDTICGTITAVNDNTLEGDEQFTITVVPINPNDGVDGSSVATITIDGKNNPSVPSGAGI